MIQKKMKLKGTYLDNYNKHENGRIWICWDENRRYIDYVSSTDQMIHCKVNDSTGDFRFWFTAIYAHNQLNKRKDLWHDIEQIYAQQKGPRLLIGDFNNVTKIEDRDGGNDVPENEYIYLVTMMSKIELYEIESDVNYFT